MQQQRKRYKTPERANLSVENVQLIDGWLEQLSGKLNGVKLTRSDIVNWTLKQKKTNLPDRDISALEKEYFDPLKALEAAVAEAKKMQNLGTELDIENLLNEKVLRKKSRSRRQKLQKTEQATTPKPVLE